MRRIIFSWGWLCLFVCGGCAARGRRISGQEHQGLPAAGGHLQGLGEIKSGRREAAIALADQVIAQYRAWYADEHRTLYAAQEAGEALLYLAMASKEKRDALVVSHAWGDAYGLKAYALVELGRLKEAREAIDAAIALSPLNSKYLSELGYLHQLDSQWAEALEVYKRSAEGAEAVAPEEYRKQLVGVALRGQGYALIEMGRLDEAEALYRRCLEIDKEDRKAANEMLYIESLRKKSKQ